MRGVLALPLLAALSCVFATAAIACSLVGAHRRTRQVNTSWARTLLRIVGVKVVVEGAGHIPPGAAVYAANHGSVLDFPVLFGHLPVDFRIIHKRSLYLVPLINLFLFAGGHISIDRGNAFRARKSLDRAAERIAGGTSVVVFPEGTRSEHGEVGVFKRGSFLLAVRSGVPVVPLSLAGVKTCMPAGLRGMQTGTVRLIVHPPLATTGRSDADAGDFAEEVRRIVAGGCAA